MDALLFLLVITVAATAFYAGLMCAIVRHERMTFALKRALGSRHETALTRLIIEMLQRDLDQSMLADVIRILTSLDDSRHTQSEVKERAEMAFRQGCEGRMSDTLTQLLWTTLNRNDHLFTQKLSDAADSPEAVYWVIRYFQLIIQYPEMHTWSKMVFMLTHRQVARRLRATNALPDHLKDRVWLMSWCRAGIE